MQSFRYQGAWRHSEPGRCLILHPDELHDGKAGTEIGFRYRVAYIEPAKIQSVLGGKALPFIEGAVSADSRLYNAVFSLLGEYDQALDELEYDDTVYDLAMAMEQISNKRAPAKISSSRKRYDYRAAELARHYISAHQDHQISLGKLEQITDRDRWKLSRDFRALFGTSPYRYLVMRRLETARSMMISGHSPSDAALESNFADQSHMIRHFKKTYGMTPNQWLSTLDIRG